MKEAARTGDAPTPVEHDWIAEARAMLIEGGVAAVQINPLAARLGVTRGGFYWRFRNRQDLLDRLLADWHATNTVSLLTALDRSGSPRQRYQRLVRLWIEETAFSPALDTAVRQWATVDAGVGERVRAADAERIAAIARVFLDAGQPAKEAMVRARVVYFHQVGYYTLNLRETVKERRALASTYTRILSGFDDDEG